MVFPSRIKLVSCSVMGAIFLMLVYTEYVKRTIYHSMSQVNQITLPRAAILDEASGYSTTVGLPTTNATPSITTIYNKYEKVGFVYGATQIYGKWEDKFSFDGCAYKCVLKSDVSFNDIEQADVVLYLYEFTSKFPQLSTEVRQGQIWLLIDHESPANSHWSTEKVNHIYNGTMTYRTDSDVFFPYGMTTSIKSSKNKQRSQVEVVKEKGAFAYVSDCKSSNYDRLGMMRRLMQYIDVDIFGGCTNIYPCARMDYECENRLHSKYRFFLSFENSLCKDYITEKFWYRINSPSKFLLVALGGSGLSEYTKAAPPDSFLHLYNFTSVDELGKHLQFLSSNPEAFNRYFNWQDSYEIVTEKYPSVGCRLCELAHRKPLMPTRDLKTWWHNPGICKDLTIN